MMSDQQKMVESLVAGKRLEPDQWYAVKATAYVKRTSAGRLETKPVSVQLVKVDSPDEPVPEPVPPTVGGGGEVDNTLPGESEPPTAEPKY